MCYLPIIENKKGNPCGFPFGEGGSLLFGIVDSAEPQNPANRGHYNSNAPDKFGFVRGSEIIPRDFDDVCDVSTSQREDNRHDGDEKRDKCETFLIFHFCSLSFVGCYFLICPIHQL